MIQHIVIFKLKNKNNILQIKQALEALPEKIEVLLSMTVGINANPNEEYDLCLIAEISSLENVQTYAEHPEHIKVAQMIKPITENRACVDF